MSCVGSPDHSVDVHINLWDAVCIFLKQCIKLYKRAKYLKAINSIKKNSILFYFVGNILNVLNLILNYDLKRERSPFR